MSLKFKPISTDQARACQNGGPDAYGRVPEVSVSDGQGNPCRHCLSHIAKGRGMLILAYRPFPFLQPYAETGPIFLCAEHCAGYEGSGVPDVLKSSPDYLIKGYNAEHRIVYGTGKVVPCSRIEAESTVILNGDSIAYVHVRSSRNNCYQLRIERG